ncbi:putative defense protein Hdd11-like [Paramacrobiotus metropolitanus]|uniref:putative defense protein Hdd11-like n=1 Tax=Paramacrobiotus metropolitanus TaxID=2943436 RepID=UPI00244643FD|nr:putative defense protein Hdd11-like [Paramacrobiotus metropolitanus]
MAFVKWLFVLLFAGSQAFPNGAPLQACRDLIPRHPFPAQRTVSPFALTVTPITNQGKNTGLKISVNDTASSPGSIAGFLIQVRDENSGRFIGKLSNVANVSKYACNARAAVTHMDNRKKVVSSLQFTWDPAGEVDGVVQVRVYATIVKAANQYWTPVASQLSS